MADKPVLGTFCWNELMTKDAAAAKTFYAALFGWKMADLPMPGGAYTVLKCGGKDAGGLMQIRPDMGQMPSLKIHVRAALANGVSRDELREILLHAMTYCGVPSAVEGFRCVREVFAEMGVAE